MESVTAEPGAHSATSPPSFTVFGLGRDRADARPGLVAAAKADIPSLSAFEVGLFGWMALMSFVVFPQPHHDPGSPVYWFLMQIGMIVGFGTAYPVNVWVIRGGFEEAI